MLCFPVECRFCLVDAVDWGLLRQPGSMYTLRAPPGTCLADDVGATELLKSQQQDYLLLASRKPRNWHIPSLVQRPGNECVCISNHVCDRSTSINKSVCNVCDRLLPLQSTMRVGVRIVRTCENARRVLYVQDMCFGIERLLCIWYMRKPQTTQLLALPVCMAARIYMYVCMCILNALLFRLVRQVRLA